MLPMLKILKSCIEYFKNKHRYPLFSFNFYKLHGMKITYKTFQRNLPFKKPRLLQP